jgi:hypothetical protein
VVVDLDLPCAFCDEEATARYWKVPFCAVHLIWLYLGLKYVRWGD